jgi:hypothetical protein
MLAEKGAQMLTPASKLGSESDRCFDKQRTRPYGFKFPSTRLHRHLDVARLEQQVGH